MQPEETGLDLRQYLNILRRWWWLLLLAAVVAAGVSYYASSQQARVYQATTAVIVGQSIQATELNTQDILTSERLAQTYANIAQRQPVLQAVVDRLGLGDDWEELKERVTVRPVRDTQLLEVTVEASSPEEARATADEVANQLILQSPTELEKLEKAENQQFVRQRLESLQQKIEAGQTRLEELEASLSGSIVAEQVQETQAEINDLEKLVNDWENNYTQLLVFVQSDQSANYLAIIEPAQADSDPIRPRVMLNTLLAGVVGLMLALGVIFLLEYLDDRVKTGDDLSRSFSLTPLGAINRIKGKSRRDRLLLDQDIFSPTAEAYRMIRSNIQFMGVDRPLRTIMITSPVPGEGKSVTTANLGIVMAQAGLRTIIVSADLRRPTQHEIFEISPNVLMQGGLTELLLSSPETDPTPYLYPTGVANLVVLTSGAIPPNPSELLGSQRMSQVLKQLAQIADVVLIDSPPAAVVTDAAVLATKVDGVVLVAKAGETRLGAMRQAVTNLQHAGANLLGVVLNNVSSRRGGGYYHYYGGYYSSQTTKSTRPSPVKQPATDLSGSRLPLAE